MNAEQVAGLRLAAAAHGQRVKRQAARAEVNQIEREGDVQNARTRIEDVVHDHAPASEFNSGTTDNTFTLDEVRGEDAWSADAGKMLAEVLHAAEDAGAIRPAGDGAWVVVDEARIFDDGQQFDRALAKLIRLAA